MQLEFAYHPANAYPLLVGTVGYVSPVVVVTVCADGAVPDAPLRLKLTV